MSVYTKAITAMVILTSHGWASFWHPVCLKMQHLLPFQMFWSILSSGDLMGQKDTGLWRPFISAAHIVQISGLLQHTSNGI